MLICLMQRSKKVWWRLNTLFKDRSFDMHSPEVWSIIDSTCESDGPPSVYGWQNKRTNPFALGLIADWLEEFGAEVPIEAVSNTEAPTVAEVIDALRAKYTELSGGN